VKKHAIPSLNLYLNGKPIERTTDAKFLGVTFDQRLTWKPHILELKKKCLRTLNILKMLNNKQYGPSSHKLLNIYKILVRSKLDYGSSIHASASQRLLQLLEPIQNTCIKLALRAFPTTPINSLQALSGISPLPFRRKCLTANHAIHSLSKLPNSPYLQLSKQFLSQTLKSLSNESPHPHNILQCITSLIPPWNQNPATFIWTFCQPEFRSASLETISTQYEAILSSYNDYVCCFTDASSTINRTSAAYMIDSEIETFTLPKFTSISSAEMAAIYQCLLKLPLTTRSKFIIFSDCQSSLRTLQKEHHDPIDAITSQVFYIQHHLRPAVTFTFVWIPAHSGIVGHDIVDAATKDTTHSAIPLINPPDLKKHTRYLLNDSWNTEWSHTSGKLRSIKPTIEDWTIKISKLCEHSPLLETAVNRVLLGHSRTTHDYIYTKQPPPMCLDCDVPLSVQHILHHCPKFSLHRTPSLKHGLKIDNLCDLIYFINKYQLYNVL